MKNATLLEGGWILHGTDGAGEEITLRLSDREIQRADAGITLGRHPDLVHHVIGDPSVSRRHLRIGLREGRLFVEDLNSLNGTVLGDRDLPPFQSTVCEPGQRLVLGEVVLKVARLGD
jgi:pSer/pThr/pTyr-binding forkhead associated (FHA) protein